MALRSKRSSSNGSDVAVDKKMKMKKIKNQKQQQQQDEEQPSSQQQRNNRTNDIISKLVIDSTVTLDTLKSLSTVLMNECTRKIFYEFTEREFSSNHVSFFFEARTFRDTFIVAQSNSSTPEAQQQSDRMEVAEVSSSRRHSSHGSINNDSPSSSSPSDQQLQLQLPMSVEVAVATTRSGSVAESSISDGANKVSRESSTLDLEGMTVSMAEQKNLEHATKLFENLQKHCTESHNTNTISTSTSSDSLPTSQAPSPNLSSTESSSNKKQKSKKRRSFSCFS
ncbi:hypothetical protein PPL_12050 [Heterostelium album PN500]|uniref:RGS domain-containing protein n=1 Tax=Heterostelium pallidum (strain ATCC 26659 / Pp 5 / PN500) TaxID=670386 RepID=D3BLJ7_HETP5|nr:hypothetical protein PPL_12050 [Heterostelium album PN500]EFA77448.1 hypothetical protein PPL_12050 [Heterostelium album PN500]|eukprot:XP_020429576.1 hypothetical protein PPL_12050 [Heterostelium album PN500]